MSQHRWLSGEACCLNRPSCSNASFGRRNDGRDSSDLPCVQVLSFHFADCTRTHPLLTSPTIALHSKQASLFSIEAKSIRHPYICYVTSTWTSTRYSKVCFRRMDRTSALTDQNLNRRHSLPVQELVDSRAADLQTIDRLLASQAEADHNYARSRSRTHMDLGNVSTRLLEATGELANLIYGESISRYC